MIISELVRDCRSDGGRIIRDGLLKVNAMLDTRFDTRSRGHGFCTGIAVPRGTRRSNVTSSNHGVDRI